MVKMTENRQNQSFKKLAVGTAQFGLDYGISNSEGQTEENAVSEIVRFLLASSILTYDTAPAYGDAEKRLGSIISNYHETHAYRKGIKIISKTVKLSTRQWDRSSIQSVISEFHQSLKVLKVNTLYGLLFHDPEDLLKTGADQLWQALSELKERGFIKKIGISVYNITEAESIMIDRDIDILQIPFSLIDQRLLSSTFQKRLKEKSIEIHTRSTFLQGLLLMDPIQLPEYFLPYKAQLSDLRTMIKDSGTSPFEAALMFALKQSSIDKVIVGACSYSQWESIICTAKNFISNQQWSTKINEISEYCKNHFHDINLIDPTRWCLE